MDQQGKGFIEDTELVRLVFPDRFHEVFGDDLSTEKATRCSCGNWVMNDAKFCRKCGKKVDHEAANRARASAKNEKDKKRRTIGKSRAVARQCSCGNFLMPDASFCRKCGQDASESIQISVGELHRFRMNVSASLMRGGR
mmetsp:Transcript_120902/g.226120  ORF Transcript_120902/g.226120 Transcript_120902/m.226120 type:complete len:140 (-) Transcript_120902:97-516(-)